MSLKNVKIEANIVEVVKLLEELKHPNLINKIIGNTCYLQKNKTSNLFQFFFLKAIIKLINLNKSITALLLCLID